MIIGHQLQKEIINKILQNYNQGLFLLFGPEAVGKFYLLKSLTEKFKPLIFNSDETILKIKTSELIQKILLLKSKEKQIIIVNDCHKFNKEAQNKLLKILEEIPSQSLVFLISHKLFKILPTIRSRAQKIRFSLVDNDEIRNFLIKNYPSADVNFLLKIFPGQIGKIVYFLNNKEKFKTIQKIIISNDLFEKFQLFYKIEKEITLEELIYYFIIYERDNLIKKNKESLKKLRYLLSLHEDSSYFLNKEMQFANIVLNIYGAGI
jgi:DNA polymerase-3 subunit delta'